MAETRLIQGRYELLERIGRGGMGEVWSARDESLGRRVAVKCLKPRHHDPDAAFDGVLRERFRREARVAAALQHRGVTVVHDFGDHDGLLYLVMELLEGSNLSELLADGERQVLPVEQVEEVARQVAAALAYTHERGIVHRDLKPANIMWLTDGTVKICDFGIARLGQDIGFTSKLTGSGIAMGTPHYMSPEQIGGAPVDHRSDLYSLGCVLYELATGAPPFDMEDAWSVLVGHRDTPPEPPRRLRPELPGHLEEIILDLLAKEPDARPADARALGRRLDSATTHLPTGYRGGTGYPPAGGAGDGAADGQWLPAWTRGMTTGPKAHTNGTLRSTPPDPAAGLAGAWIPRRDTRRPTPPEAPRPTPSPEAVAVLASRHDAGLSLGRLGRWSEAGEVHRAVLTEREHLLGADHPDTLGSRYELAFSLSRTGHPADALREYVRVSQGRRHALGPDHPDTLAASQETAYELGRLGRHAEADQVYREVLAARVRTMGADHPDTLRCRHNLAFNLGRLGRLEDSCRYATEVAAARTRVLGADHPDTLVTRYEVAYAMGRLGRWRDALETYQEVAEARGRVLGADHPDTFAARYEAGISLGRLGRSEEALRLYRHLATDRTRVQGAEDPETLRARHGIGVNLGRLGRWEEALAEATAVHALRERALGPGHPDTLVSRREVAVGLGWLGRWAEALAHYRAVAEVREHTLGAAHPDTLAARNDEAHCLEQLGHGAEAVALYRRVATLRHHPPGSPVP
ncbi:tetratricopeptide repeat protein [Streptomyces sp. NPDC058045]|uniref:serine/threonine-protein kinase n=1 Tax=Streptomyces sp. NPDC058045 TaxID=3346311 RepID=UPI0036EB9C72